VAARRARVRVRHRGQQHFHGADVPAARRHRQRRFALRSKKKEKAHVVLRAV
jgi:hypothetical protein